MMGVPGDAYINLINAAGGSILEAIKKEVADHGTAEDKENLKNILAGTRQKDWPPTKNKHHQEIRPPTIDQLLKHPNAKAAGLQDCHIVGIRLYTSSTFKRINDPLRAQTKPHPFAVTTAVIDEGLKQLRAASIGTTVYADPSEEPPAAGSAVGQHTAFFWRGVRDKTVSKEFMEQGGSDLGCMSTSVSKDVAASFAKSDCPLIFRLVTNDFMQRGADVSFLSVYPHEKEALYPPLTRLKPLGPARAELFGEIRCQVIDVEPIFAT